MKLKNKYHRLPPKDRLYKIEVPIIGLTGGIASGKSTVGRLLIAEGFPVINADHLVKDVYSMPEVLSFVKRTYPDVIEADAIVFPLLREKVFSDATVKFQIEALIYQKLPLAFNLARELLGTPEVIFYDVPLLFEKKLKALFDLTVLVYAPRNLQRDRLLLRDGHHELIADAILDQQLDIEEKRLEADFIIPNLTDEADLAEEVKQFLRQTFEA